MLLRSGQSLLVFRHPEAGMQLIKGTLELGETIEAGTLRELAEESGITNGRIVGDLGFGGDIADGQIWHFRPVEAGGLPDQWSHTTSMTSVTALLFPGGH